jgi:phosphotransferase family enzyme
MIQGIVSRIVETMNWTGAEASRSTSWLVYTNRGQKRSSVLLFLFLGGSSSPRAIVKLSRDAASIFREFTALQRLFSRLPDHVPEPYLHGEIRGLAYFAMEAIAAEAPIPINFAGLVPKALRGIITFHRQLAEGPMSHAALGREVLDPLGEFERTWASHHRDLSLLCESLRRRLDILMTVQLPQLPQHGDFCVDNLLVRPDGRIVVIDWEEFGAVRLPAYDLLTLFASAEPRGDQFAHLDLFRTIMESYGTEMRIDRGWLAALVPIGLMRLALFRHAESQPEPIQYVLSLLRALAVPGGHSAWRGPAWC